MIGGKCINVTAPGVIRWTIEKLDGGMDDDKPSSLDVASQEGKRDKLFCVTYS